jgi:hypothetical protein
LRLVVKVPEHGAGPAITVVPSRRVHSSATAVAGVVNVQDGVAFVPGDVGRAVKTGADGGVWS